MRHRCRRGRFAAPGAGVGRFVKTIRGWSPRSSAWLNPRRWATTWPLDFDLAAAEADLALRFPPAVPCRSRPRAWRGPQIACAWRCFPLWNHHPEPIGLRRATPLLLFQHRARQFHNPRFKRLWRFLRAIDPICDRHRHFHENGSRTCSALLSAAGGLAEQPGRRCRAAAMGTLRALLRLPNVAGVAEEDRWEM